VGANEDPKSQCGCRDTSLDAICSRHVDTRRRHQTTLSESCRTGLLGSWTTRGEQRGRTASLDLHLSKDALGISRRPSAVSSRSSKLPSLLKAHRNARAGRWGTARPRDHSGRRAVRGSQWLRRGRRSPWMEGVRDRRVGPPKREDLPVGPVDVGPEPRGRLRGGRLDREGAVHARQRQHPAAP
jgi:hypothetical protein